MSVSEQPVAIVTATGAKVQTLVVGGRLNVKMTDWNPRKHKRRHVEASSSQNQITKENPQNEVTNRPVYNIKSIAISGVNLTFNKPVIIYESGSRPPRKRSPFRFQVRDPTLSFCGREQFLEDLFRKLHSTDSSTAKQEKGVQRVCQIICGPSGIGKTQVVKKFITKYGKIYSNIVWINSNSEEDLRRSFEKLYKKLLGRSLRKNSREFIDPADSDQSLSFEPKALTALVKNVYRILSEHKTLLIFDDALCYLYYNKKPEPRRSLQQFLPPSSSGQNGARYPKIIITSSNDNPGDWGPLHKQLVRLPSLSLEERVSYLKNQLVKYLMFDSEESQRDLESLVNALQGVPLKLEKAVQFILDKNQRAVYDNEVFTISQYLEVIQSQAEDQ